MKRLARIKNLVSGLSLSALLVASFAASAYAAPTGNTGQAAAPPAASKASGPQAKAPFEAGTKDAKPTAKLGPTSEVKVNAEGKIEAGPAVAQAGNVANVDFQTSLKYCYRNMVYTPVRNATSTTKYVRVMLYNQGGYRGDLYATVNANSISYPAFYGIDGVFYAYLYVWNGTSYQYDEYLTSTNTCNVSVTRTYNSAGWVQLKIQNLGTAYAAQVSSELAPFPGSGTYTGTHYDYPAAGGAAIYRWFWVGTSPYGITSYTSGSWNSPYMFTGDL